MNIEELVPFFRTIKDILHLGNMNLYIIGINFCIICVLFSVYYDIKLRDIFKERKFLVLLALVYLVDFILENIIGNIPVAIPIISFFLVNIIFLLKDKELFNLFTPNANKLKKKDENSFNDSCDLDYKMNRLNKDDNFNLLDILYLYDYITEYQRRKVIQDMIYEDVETMVKHLTEYPAINTEELKEAKAILNLVELQGKIITKEEALMHLVNRNKTAKETNNEESRLENHDEI